MKEKDTRVETNDLVEQTMLNTFREVLEFVGYHDKKAVHSFKPYYRSKFRKQLHNFKQDIIKEHNEKLREEIKKIDVSGGVSGRRLKLAVLEIITKSK